MLVKTILNTIEKFKSFVYGKVILEKRTFGNALIIELLARKNSPGECCDCGAAALPMILNPLVNTNMCPYGGYQFISVILLGVCTANNMASMLSECLGQKARSA